MSIIHVAEMVLNTIHTIKSYAREFGNATFGIELQ